jgi:hypothetical protein
MATSPNYNWPEPDNSDLVKNGALAIRTAVDAIDSSLVDLKGGTTGQVLSKTSNTDMDFTWVAQDDSNAIQNAIVDAKGDLIAATAADTPARLAVGANDTVLTADSSTSTGLKWATPPATGFPAFTTYTPTISSETGSPTTVTATGNYSQSGKVVMVNFDVTITNAGTAGGYVNVSLPINAKTGSLTSFGVSEEFQSSGLMGFTVIAPASSVTLVKTRRYDFASFWTSGFRIVGSTSYEVA